MTTNSFTASKIEISKTDARRFMLAHHYLWPPRQLEDKRGIMDLFNRLGCVQFDTINVVGRNADLVLQARVKDYTPELLDQLLYQERALIDGWDKVASIYQTTDYPYFSWHRKRMSESHYQRSEDVAEIIPEVLAAIEEHGPISSLHFKDAPKTDWFWSATSLPRAAMETLYAEGRTGISHRVNTRRYFDLIDRLVPSAVLAQTDPNQDLEEYHNWHVLRRIGSMGLAADGSGEHWQGIYELKAAAKRRAVLEQLADSGQIKAVEVAGLEGLALFIREEDLGRLEAVQAEQPPTAKMVFIAPLDNLIWNRKLIGDLFDFQYVWEVYKPKDQREYGYYVLPVVYGDAFIARVDMKLDRKTNTIGVLNWWWQQGYKPNDEITAAARECFEAFKAYLGAAKFEVDPAAKNRTFLCKVAK